MNHVPVKLLQRVRWALVAYNGVLLVVYVLLTLVLKRVEPAPGFDMVIAAVAILQAIYELCNSTFLFRDNYLAKTWLSLSFSLILTFIIAHATGVYASPFIFAVIPLVLISQAISPYIGVGITGAMVINLLLSVSGAFNRPVSTRGNAIAAAVSGVATIVGYIFWRSKYLNRPTSEDRLSSIINTERAKSDIILNSIDDGVILIDESKVIRVFNPAAGAISGWPVEEALGLDYRSVLKFVDDKGKPYAENQDPFQRTTIDKKTVRDSGAGLISRANKAVAITINVSPLTNEKQEVIGAVAVFRDVSQERSQEKRSADFVSTASHEMRTPVAAIEGYLALALNDRVSTIDSKAREYLQKAHESTQHLGKLFQDLLTSTRAEDGRLTNHPLVIEMSSFTEKLVEDLRFSAEKKGLHMQYVMGTHANDGASREGNKVIQPLYYVHADPERIREVITNLFDNAVKYTDSGTITIGLTGNNDVVQMSVKDTGPGIPADDIPHLFQKFYRVDNSSTRTIGGTGLGLFICRKVIELYNGRIWVESKEGNGSTFYINLPRITADQAKQLQATETTSSTTVASLSSVKSS